MNEADFPSDGTDDPSKATPSGRSGGPGSDGRTYPSPSERRWIHPAELPSASNLTRGPVVAAPRPWVQRALGLCAVGMLVAGVVLLTQGPRTPPSPEPSVASGITGVPESSRATATEMVALSISSPDGVRSGTGIVIDGSGVKLISTSTIPADSTISLTALDGTTTSARAVATDTATSVTLLVAEQPIRGSGLTSASATPGQKATALSIEANGSSSPTINWQSTSISSVDASFQRSVGWVGTIEAHGGLSDTSGSILVDEAGRLIGIAAPSIGTDAYLPATFVVALSQQILSGSPTNHGSLNIVGRSTTSRPGVEITAVPTTSPAANKLLPGDIVVKVGGTTVQNYAELVDALYAFGVGDTFTLGVIRKNESRSVLVSLAALA
ncbi:MAG: S1C family serine protease [Actinomycetes bacterium]